MVGILAEGDDMKKICSIIFLLCLIVSNTFAAATKGRVSIQPEQSAISVAEDTTPPSIIITSPDVTRSLKVVSKGKSVTVTGKATDESGVFEVTVNGEQARLDDQGNFSADILLKVGENVITVTATDTRRNKATKQFTVARAVDAPIRATQLEVVPKLSTDRYYALIIGVKDYMDSSITPLDFPLQDSQRIFDMLTKTYTFEPENVTHLRNPDQSRIIDALDQLANRIGENDNLLIFYAGHGYWDEKMKQGYWLPSDAKKMSRSKWLSNSTIRDYINAIKSKHTLLVADACFSGGIFKTRSAFDGASKAVQELLKLPSRKAMTSGTMKEVPDRSVFVEYLLKRLNDSSEQYLPSEQLFSSMRQAVINNSSNGQVPQFGEIRETGDEGGDFVFVKR